MHIARLLLAVLIAGIAAASHAVAVRFAPVADNIYAFVGETGTRTYDNEGLNANGGRIVTPAGAVLIDSGAGFNRARQVHAAVRAVTTQPMRWVINTGGQDHRLLNAAELHPGNASRIYLELERE